MAGDKEGNSGTMKESMGGLQAPKLTSTNYAAWSVMVKVVLGANGLQDAIDKEKGPGIEERKKFMALGVIFQTLPEDVMLQMAKYSEPKDVWEALRVRYLGAERTQKARIQMLTSELDGLKMSETESIDEYAAKLGGVQSKYKSLGATLEEEVVVRKFLNSMPDKYLPIVSSIEQFADIEKMAFEDVVGRLKAYEERNKFKNVNESSSQSQLMFTQNEKKVENYRGRGRYNGRGRGYPRWNNERENMNDEQGEDRKKKPEEWQDRRKNLRCYNCDKIGHYSSECKAPSKGKEEANLTKTEDVRDIDPSLFMAVCSTKKVSLNEERVIPGVFERNEEGMWYLDNGASHHMSGKKEFFTTLDEKVSGQVTFGDGSEIEIKGKGNVTVVSKNGEKKTFCNVFYMPKLKTNLLSLGQLDEGGCKIEIANGMLRLHDQKGRLLMKSRCETD
ncbi:putative RNA-directed DNA polymerase [Helianthus annuus]|nr:putative RNA-directed DNA polymerase [Helianthus annuus]